MPLTSMRRSSTLTLLAAIAMSAVLLLADVLVAPSTSAFAAYAGAGRLLALTIALVVVTVASDQFVIAATMVLALSLFVCVAALLGQWRGQTGNGVVVAAGAAMIAAVLVPWGPRFQSLLVTVLTAIVISEHFALSHPNPPSLLLLIAVPTMLVSVHLSREIAWTRTRLADRGREEFAARREADETNARLEACILERTASLQAAAEEFEELCFAASHDVRPPLRTIAGFAQILRETAEEDQRELYDRIVATARATGVCIDKILMLVRAEQKEIAADLSTLRDVALSEKAIHASSDPACSWVVEEDTVDFGSSPEHARLLRTLLRHVASADAGPAARQIHVGFRRDDGIAVLSVRATGYRADGQRREDVEYALSGMPSCREIPSDLTEVAAAARALTAARRGRVWLDRADESGITFAFHGSDTGAELKPA